MTSPLSQSSSSAAPSLVAFEDMSHREYFLSYGTGVGLHIPLTSLQDGPTSPTMADDTQTFMTTIQAVEPPPSIRRRNTIAVDSRVAPVGIQSVEEERSSHPDWNEKFQAATEAGDEVAALAAIDAFENEATTTIRDIVLAKVQGGADISPLPGFQGRYVHRGIYYLDCMAEPELLRFYGCMEAVHKAVSAEIRASRFMWKLWAKGSAFVPLCCELSYLGARFLAVAMPPVNSATVCGGPEGVGHVRTITHVCAKAVENVSKRLGMADLHISDDHRRRLNDKCVWCSIESVTHFGLDRRVYIFEVARSLPPTEPRVSNALLNFARVPSRPTSSTRTASAEEPQYDVVPARAHSDSHLVALLQPSANRLSNGRKRTVAYKLLRPEMISYLATERIEVPTESGNSTTPLNIVNALDGVTSLACTPLGSARSTELATIATTVVLERGIRVVVDMCSETNPSITPQLIAKALHANGVNLRCLGDIYRGVERSVNAGALARKDSSWSRSESAPRLPPLGSHQRTGTSGSLPAAPATARVASSVTKPPKPPTGARTARGPRKVEEPCVVPHAADPSRIKEALVAIKIEGIARVFRAIVEEHWRALLVPVRTDERDSYDKMADASVADAAERSFRRAKLRSGATKASELLTELKFLDAQFEMRGDDLRLLSANESVRSLSLVESALAKSTPYCTDSGALQRVKIGEPSTDTEQRARELIAKLLTFLIFPSPAADKFWDVALCTEIWTKYNGLGQRQELRSVPAVPLLERVVALLEVDVGDAAELLQKAEVSRGILPRHILGVGVRCKGFSSTETKASERTRIATGVSTARAMERSSLEQRVQRLREGPPTEELLSALSEMEQRLVLSGGKHKSQLMLIRLKINNVTARLREARIREVWSRNGLDGIVYVPCGRCPVLVNLSTRDRHRCMSQSDVELATILGHETPKAVVDRLPVPVGLADGTILDLAITASSFRKGCRPEFSRLDCAVTDGWEPAPEDKYTAWLQVDLGHEREICAVATQGTPSGAYCRSYRVAHSCDRVNWVTFQGAYKHENRALKCDPLRYDAGGKRSKDDGSWVPVSSGDRIVRLPVGGLFGNTDSKSVAVNTFEESFTARYIRFLPGADGDYTRHGLRVEVYAADDHAADAALLTMGTERVPLWLVDLEAPLALQRRVVDESGRESAVLSTRTAMAAKEISVLERINSIEGDVLDDVEAPLGRGVVVKPSTSLPGLYAEWLELLEDWGPERAGDITVASNKLATYLVGEAELVAKRSSQHASPTVLNQVAPLIFASSRQSKALEPLLRRLRKLFAHAPATVLPLFKRVARWAGRGNMILPYLAAELAHLCDGAAFLSIAQSLLDESIAAERQPTEADGPALLDDDGPRRAALLVYTHRKFKQVVESAERIAVNSEFSIPLVLEDLLPPAPV